MWEYTTLDVQAGNSSDLQVQLNALGSIGWEVVGFAAANPIVGVMVFTAILKRPVAPWPSPGIAAAGWATDPTGRFEQRYWDGAHWTQHVSTGGVADTDFPNRR